jgi:hypothetical protein
MLQQVRRLNLPIVFRLGRRLGRRPDDDWGAPVGFDNVGEMMEAAGVGKEPIRSSGSAHDLAINRAGEQADQLGDPVGRIEQIAGTLIALVALIVIR